MAINNPYKAYQSNTVTTASPGELTLMLYNGCLKFIHLTRTAIINENIEEKNINIQKAQNIIHELMVTLKTDTDIGRNMLALYDYANRQLIEANIKNDLSILKEVEGIITEFRDTWKQVIQLNRQQQYGAQGGQA